MRFYAASLSDYNNGRLHGVWVDASSDLDEMQEVISKMLTKSRYPNVKVTCLDCDGDGGHGDDTCPTCAGHGEVASAEEWTIHDYDDMPNMGETSDLKAIAEYVELVEEYDDDYNLTADQVSAIIDHYGSVTYAREEMDNFIGVYEEFRDYSDEMADEMLADASEFAARYFDYEAFASDMEMEHRVIRVGGNVLIFHY